MVQLREGYGGVIAGHWRGSCAAGQVGAQHGAGGQARLRCRAEISRATGCSRPTRFTSRFRPDARPSPPLSGSILLPTRSPASRCLRTAFGLLPLDFHSTFTIMTASEYVLPVIACNCCVFFGCPPVRRLTRCGPADACVVLEIPAYMSMPTGYVPLRLWAPGYIKCLHAH